MILPETEAEQELLLNEREKAANEVFSLPEVDEFHAWCITSSIHSHHMIHLASWETIGPASR